MLGQWEGQQPSAVEAIFTYFATVMSGFFRVLIHSPDTSLSPFTFWAGTELQIFMFGESTIADSHHRLKGLPNSLASHESLEELATEPGKSNQVQIVRGLQSLLWSVFFLHGTFLLLQNFCCAKIQTGANDLDGIQVSRRYSRYFSFGLKPWINIIW